MGKVNNILLFPFRKLNDFKKWFIRANWFKKILAIIGILILLFIIKSIFFRGNKNQYLFDTVARGNISQIVTETGNVIAGSETDVYSPTTGSLSKIYVKDGDNVNAGDKLFDVRSTATAQEQAAAYANYLSAQSNLLAAQAQLNTLQNQMFIANQTFVNDAGTANPDTSDPKYIEENSAWLAAESNYKNQQAVIAQDQAALNSASLAYQATQNSTVTAPITGIISNLIGLVGAKVIAQQNSATSSNLSTSTTPSTVNVTPVMVIGNNNGFAIETAVSEVDVDKIKLNQKANLIFSAIPNKTYTGTVNQIDSYGTNNAGVINYNVFVIIDNPDNNIKPNMTANLTITTAESKNVLTVANSAIVPYQNGKALQVLETNKKIKFIPVIIGLHGFTRSEVIKGINAGTKVILGNTTLTNNQTGGPAQ